MRASPAILDAIERLRREGRVVEHGPQQTADAAIGADVSEEDFMAAVIAFARKNGWRVYHTRDSRKSVAGFPDLVMIRGDVQLVAELKSATGQPTAEQSNWLEAFRSAGVRAFLWRPSAWPEIVALLEGLPRSMP